MGKGANEPIIVKLNIAEDGMHALYRDGHGHRCMVIIIRPTRPGVILGKVISGSKNVATLVRAN